MSRILIETEEQFSEAPAGIIFLDQLGERWMKTSTEPRDLFCWRKIPFPGTPGWRKYPSSSLAKRRIRLTDTLIRESCRTEALDALHRLLEAVKGTEAWRQLDAELVIDCNAVLRDYAPETIPNTCQTEQIAP